MAALDRLAELDRAGRAKGLASLGLDDPEVHALVARDLEAMDALDARPPWGGGMPALEVALGRLMEVDPPGRIGPYQIHWHIGSGGQADVFFGIKPASGVGELPMTAAIKRLKTADPSVARRLAREREILDRFRDERIARIYDEGDDAGHPYLVMEYVEGESLDAFCDRRSLDIPGRLELFLKVCRAVRVAHEHDVIHCDLKPENIRVTAATTPKLLDFGIARSLRAIPGQTGTTTRIGDRPLTPAYASPGQVKNETPAPGDDIYALGVILFELLTGHRPHALGHGDHWPTLVKAKGATPRPSSVLEAANCSLAPAGDDVAAWVARTRGEPIPKLRQRLRGELDAIVLMSLRFDPRERYRSVAALISDVSNYIDGNRMVRAYLGSRRYRLRKTVASPWFYLPTATALVLAIVSGWALVERKAAQDAADSEMIARGEAVRAQGQSEVARVQAQERLAAQYVSNADRSLERNDPLAALPWYVGAMKLARGSTPLDPDSERLHRLRFDTILSGSPRLIHLWPHPGKVDFATFSDDGTRVLTLESYGPITVRDAFTGRPVWTHARDKEGGRFVYAAISPDGKLVAVATDGATTVFDIASDRPAFPACDWELARVVVGPGLWLGVEEDRGKVRVHDLRTGRQVSAPADGIPGDGPVAIDAEGLRIAVAGEGEIRVVDTRTGVGPPPLPFAIGGIPPALSPDGRWVAYGDPAAILVYSIDSGKVAFTLHPTEGIRPNSLIFSPDGWHLAAYGDGREVDLWRLGSSRSASGTEPGGDPTPPRLLALKHPYRVTSAAFSRDARLLLVGGLQGDVHLWSAEDGREAMPPLWHGASVSSVESPDGRRILTSSGDGLVRVWDSSPPAATPRDFDPDGGLATRVVVGPDGKRVAVILHEAGVAIVDPSTGAPAFPSPGSATSLVFSSDGRRLVLVGEASTRVLDARNGVPVTPILEHADSTVQMAAFTPDGARLATVDAEGKVRVWDAGTGALLGQLALPSAGRSREQDFEVFRYVGGRLLALGDRSLFRIDSGPGAPRIALQTPLDDISSLLDLSRDGSRIVSTSLLASNSIEVRDAVGGQVVAGPVVAHKADINAVRFTAAGDRFVTASDDGSARVWETSTIKPVTPPLRHDDRVQDAAFSPDSELVVTAGIDGLIRLWLARTGDPVATYRVDGRAESVEFSEDGRTLVARTSSGIRFWSLEKRGDDRPLDRLADDAILHAAHEVQGAAGLVPLRSGELMRLWNASPGQSLLRPSELLAWEWSNVTRPATRADPAIKIRILENMFYKINVSIEPGGDLTWRSREAGISTQLSLAYYQLGSRAAEEGRWEEAYRVFDREVRRLKQGQSNRGEASLHMGKTLLAFDDLWASVPADWSHLGKPSKKETGIDRQEAEFRRDYWNRTRVELDRLVNERPDDFNAIAARALTLLQLGELSAAVADATKAAGLESRDRRPWFIRGLAEARLGDLPSAIADFTRAINIDATLQPARFERALAHARLGDAQRAGDDLLDYYLGPFATRSDWEETLQAFSELVNRQPGDWHGRIGRALALLQLQRNSEAEAEASRALTMGGDWRVRFILGFIRSQSGDWKGALSEYDRVAASTTNTPWFFWYRRALARTETGDLIGAIADHSAALDRDRSQLAPISDRADLHQTRGEYTAAISDYSEAIRLSPIPDGSLLTGRARSFYHLGRHGEAEADATQALAIGYLDGGWTHVRRALYRIHLGAASGALADLLQAEQQGLNDPVPWCDVVEALNLAIARTPRTPDLTFARGVARLRGHLET